MGLSMFAAPQFETTYRRSESERLAFSSNIERFRTNYSSGILKSCAFVQGQDMKEYIHLLSQLLWRQTYSRQLVVST